MQELWVLILDRAMVLACPTLRAATVCLPDVCLNVRRLKCSTQVIGLCKERLSVTFVCLQLRLHLSW